MGKGVTFLKETAKGGISRSENRFSLASGSYLKTPALNGEQSKYCILSGGRLFFGTLNGSSGSETVILDNMHEMKPIELFQGDNESRDQMMLEAIANQAIGKSGDTEKIKEELSRSAAKEYAALEGFLTAEIINIDLQFDVNIDFLPDVLPFYAKGSFKLYCDYTYENPSAWENSIHTIHMYTDLNIEAVGLKSDEVVTDKYERGVVSYKGISLVTIKATLRNFVGEVDWYMHGRFGFKFRFYTWYLDPVDWDDWSCWLDDENTFDMGISHVKAKGDLEAGFTVGPSVGVDLYIFTIGGGCKMDFGVAMTAKDYPSRFMPEDTKEQWHVCNECIQEEIRYFMGPAYVYLDMPFDGMDKSWNLSDRTYSDPTYSFYFSNTFDECEEGECPHWAWKTKVDVRSKDGPYLPDVAVSYDPVPSHCETYASGTTDQWGSADLYMMAGKTYDLTAKAVSLRDPEWIVTKTVSFSKEAHQDECEIRLDIPLYYVHFINSASGDPEPWPQDISFMPFFSGDVQIPDTVPALSGRVFTGWNTKEDGSGTSYMPGTKLTLEDDLTLWAQWQIAGDSWYVIYNANGGTKAPEPQIVRKGRDAVLTAELPEGGKLIFKGWTPDKQHPETVYQPRDTLKYDSEKNVVVLYALWDLSPVPEPIHVSFDANGVEKAKLPADVWFERGTWLQLEPAYAPLGSVCTFRGWSEDPGAEEPEYQAGKSYYFFRDTHLFAVWNKLDSMTLTFLDSLPGASSGMPKPITILPSMSPYVHIPDQIPQKSGRVFTGWNTKKDGSGTRYAPGSVMTLRKSTVLWAQWEVAGSSWYVIYNANGGTKAPGAQIIPLGEDAVLTTELPEYGTMAFKGWAANPDATTAQYMPGDTLKYDSGKNYVVLYALWDLSPAERPVLITFKANGGQPDTVPEPISRPKSTWFLLPETEPVWDEQHLFLGWADSPEATEAKWKAGAAAVFDQDTTLYAVWKAQYKVISGAGSVWVKKSSIPLRFIADGDLRYFVELRIDGKRFMKGVEISSGSTVAVIRPWALEKLSVGEHTVTFKYEDGEASASFTIRKALPPTGDQASPALWLLLIVLGMAGIAMVGIRAYTVKKKR